MPFYDMVRKQIIDTGEEETSEHQKRFNRARLHTLLQLGTSSCNALILSDILSLRNCIKMQSLSQDVYMVRS